MAAFALSSVRAAGELACVRVLVAVGADCVGKRGFEVAALVAGHAGYGEVLPDERVIGF